jgi:LPXTG-motif cell wall-anchored protein
MKRLIFSVLAVCLLIAGAAVAQNANTTAPGPTVQREPGLTSNNMPNPGNPQTDLSNNDTYTQTTGNAEATATGETTLKNETEPATGPDVDVDTGAKAEGAVDVDVSSKGDADTDASGIDETGTDTDTGALPDTASEFPLLALAGLLALATAFSLRVSRRKV